MTIRERILSTQGRMMRQKTWQVGTWKKIGSDDPISEEMASGAKLTAKRSSAASFSLGWREFVLESSSSELCLLYTSKFKPIGVRIDLLNDLHRTNLSCSELVVVTSRKSILRKDSPIKIANFKLYVPSPSVGNTFDTN
ncbi:hypothetical protein CRG98_036238 [Punica granatum]|uniref:Uncharacterized protein n=1 Tax=Punica granatum TaxID=22663 RepID=A0A2I0IH85_PUNGR|nr:hypothetical protein CRG98_036238 [Punica granatum]